MNITLPDKTKPSKVVGRDSTRSAFNSAYIEERDGEVVLLATDSYKLLWLPIKAVGGTQPTFVPYEALRVVEKTGHCEIGDYIEPLDQQGSRNGVLFRLPAERKRPSWADLPWPDEPKTRFTVGLNAKFLYELSQAMASRHDAVKLTFDLAKAVALGDGRTYQRPVFVEPVGGSNGARGQLMPVRIVS